MTLWDLKKKTRDAAYNHIGLVWCGLWCLTPLSTIFSYIVAVSFIGGENRSTRGKSVAVTDKLYHIMYKYIEYTLPWTGFEPTTLVAIGTDCTSSCKCNYHTITTTTAPIITWAKQSSYNYYSLQLLWLQMNLTSQIINQWQAVRPDFCFIINQWQAVRPDFCLYHKSMTSCTSWFLFIS